jgi:hypothetical protein
MAGTPDGPLRRRDECGLDLVKYPRRRKVGPEIVHQRWCGHQQLHHGIHVVLGEQGTRPDRDELRLTLGGHRETEDGHQQDQPSGAAESPPVVHYPVPLHGRRISSRLGRGIARPRAKTKRAGLSTGAQHHRRRYPASWRLCPPLAIQQERGSAAAHGGPHERCRDGANPSSSLVQQTVVLASRRRQCARAPPHPGSGGALTGHEHGIIDKADCGHLNTPTRSCVSTWLDSPGPGTVAIRT